MRTEFKNLRIKQLERSLKAYVDAHKVPRPPLGWVHAIRAALGVSASELAKKLGASRQLILQQERAEVEDRITLKSLRTLADALDCDLVYALVPRALSLRALIEQTARSVAIRDVRRVEHSMALEDQAVGGVAEAVKEEAKRLSGKHSL
jgi:predicted DNA-binding mobile mystery protein A